MNKNPTFAEGMQNLSLVITCIVTLITLIGIIFFNCPWYILPISIILSHIFGLWLFILIIMCISEIMIFLAKK